MERLPFATSLTFEPLTANVPVPVTRALAVMGGLLADCPAVWLVGGSCGALLQGVALDAVPRDLDVYVDASGAKDAHARLQSFSLDEQAYSETGMYGSLLSHYEIEGVQVELVGSLSVRVKQSEYEVRVVDVLSRFARAGSIGGVPVRFMPLAHELLFNVLRDRPDRYEPIAAAMRTDMSLHRPSLLALLASNRIGPDAVSKLRELLPLPDEREETTDER